uniref:Uncharacterized protein n=1 Tax=Rhizophora mucronata TaxID=61149 RepID=A0A2P2PUS3_RHIMU
MVQCFSLQPRFHDECIAIHFAFLLDVVRFALCWLGLFLENRN